MTNATTLIMRNKVNQLPNQAKEEAYLYPAVWRKLKGFALRNFKSKSKNRIHKKRMMKVLKYQRAAIVLMKTKM